MYVQSVRFSAIGRLNRNQVFLKLLIALNILIVGCSTKSSVRLHIRLARRDWGRIVNQVSKLSPKQKRP